MFIALASALFLGWTPSAAATQTPSTADRSAHQRVVLSYFHDVLDGRRIELLDQLFLPDCVINRPEGTLQGLAGIRGVVERNIAAYSTFSTTVHDIIESGDRVVVRLTHRSSGAGMFRSRLGDYDVKNRTLTWGAIVIFRMQNGRIAEQWVMRDELGILLSGALLTPAP